MCGVFGWFGPDLQSARQIAARQIADRMGRMLRHRGPDDDGFELGQGWALGFRRLSILDLSSLGHQPMQSPDGRFWIVFNGEIYNYLELRRDLEREGEEFRGGSDTEVLLRLLARKGADALPLLNGMFAFAFVDTQARTFLLARDRLGVKPLYYKADKNGLCFASELKALLVRPDASRNIDPVAVAQYLAHGYLPSETCIFSGYAKLAPGHTLAGSLDRPQEAQAAPYWKLKFNDDAPNDTLSSAQLESLHDILLDSVRIRLRSDVPLGVFLSGGIDSGLIAALAAEASSGPLLALTVGFSEESADETALARATAQHVGLEHRVVVQQANQLADLDRLAWYFDEPFGDPSALPTYALCEMGAQHATVFLSGDGGDEAFCGYRHYVEYLRNRLVIELGSVAAWGVQFAARFTPEMSLMRHRLSKLGLADRGAAAAFDRLPGDPAVWRLAHPDLRPLASQAGDPLWSRWADSRGEPLTIRQQRLDYEMYLPDDILVKVDRASMAHSIEVRSPLLDYRLVEWAAQLPRAAMVNTTAGKLPLRQLASRLLPPAVASGVKKGFGAPMDDWFRQPVGIALARDRLLSPEARRLGFWDVGQVERIIQLQQEAKGRDFGQLLWRLVMFEAWARHYAGAATFQAGPPALALNSQAF